MMTTLNPTPTMVYIETGFKQAWQPAEKALREALYQLTE